MSFVATIPDAATTQRARRAVSLFFFTNGALIAGLVPHYPAIKESLGLSATMYGIAIAAVPTGAMIMGPLAGWLVRKYSSAHVATAGTIILATLIALASTAPHVGILMTALFFVGASDSIVDVAQNAHGLRVQRAYKRSIINSFHALWSVGAVTGGALAALAINLDVNRTLQLILSGAVICAITLYAFTLRLPGHDATEAVAPEPATSSGSKVRSTFASRTVLILALLSLISIAGALVEDAGSSWATLYFQDSLGADPGLAPLGFIVIVGAQFIGRILGDRMIDAWGQRFVGRLGGILIAAGFGIALAFPSIWLTILGFACAGFGSATLVPVAMQNADEIPGLSPGTGLTIVSWLLRVGFLVSPPLVGAIADSTNLRTGLLIIPVAGLFVVAATHVFHSKPRTHA